MERLELFKIDVSLNCHDMPTARKIWNDLLQYINERDELPEFHQLVGMLHEAFDDAIYWHGYADVTSDIVAQFQLLIQDFFDEKEYENIDMIEIGAVALEGWPKEVQWDAAQKQWEGEL